MANDEDLARLWQGAAVWNNSRAENSRRYVDLSGPDLRGADLSNADLRGGRLLLAFLRGCGLPDKLIDYLPSLPEEAIQYYSCFISYSSKDDAFANGCTPTCRTMACAAGSRRMTCRSARRPETRSTPFGCATSCC